jgi:hypothetical protein
VQVVSLVGSAGIAGEEWVKAKPYLDAFTVIAGGGEIDGDRLRSRLGIALR